MRISWLSKMSEHESVLLDSRSIWTRHRLPSLDRGVANLACAGRSSDANRCENLRGDLGTLRAERDPDIFRRPILGSSNRTLPIFARVDRAFGLYFPLLVVPNRTNDREERSSRNSIRGNSLRRRSKKYAWEQSE